MGQGTRRTNFNHDPCYRQGLHPPTRAGRQQCRASGPASRASQPGDTNPSVASAVPAPDAAAIAVMRHRREAAAERYRPKVIRVLLVAQAPPAAVDRYFYFPHVAVHDWLFRAVTKALLPQHQITRTNKASLLAQLRDRGVFLIDLKPDPIDEGDGADLSSCVPALLARITELAPERIILIKVDVYDAAYSTLAAAGLPVSDVRVPFPSSGRQTEFAEAFGRALADGG